MQTRLLSLVVLAATPACIAERGPFANRMAHSGTNYLARAARQPVNWQPWGREAFALATRLDRPVLLYVGGEACRWCMETDRAIYTDPEIGTLINALFVPIRVDRDERPDVAQRYQSAVEVLAGLRGWPLTVFLTADGAPFFGGTYFPADDPMTGRGLKQILPDVAKSYHDQRTVVVQHAALVRQLMLTGTSGGAGGGAGRGILRLAPLHQEIASVRSALDRAVNLHAALGSMVYVTAASLLITAYVRDADTSALDVARRALDLMLDSLASPASSGDDPPRLVRAALLGTLARAWVVTGTGRYHDAGRSLAQALDRELRQPPEPRTGGGTFTDQEAYVIRAVLLAAATFGESGAEKHARAALDDLLPRVYAHGWGVRHSAGPQGTQGGGLLQDQVQLAAACLAAHQITQDVRYLEIARDLAQVLEQGYADPTGGYFDTTVPPVPPTAPDLAAPAFADRTKHVLDDLLPGANAAAAQVLLQLADVTGDAGYRRRAEATLEAFAGSMAGAGVRGATFLEAARTALAYGGR